MAVRAVLFDLDGTGVQTREASWELFAKTSREFNLGIDTREDFFRLMEGNLYRSLEQLCPDKARAEAAKRHFMELLRTQYHPDLIPGMADVIKALAPNFTLAVISSNTMETIRRVLGEAGIATCFAHVFAGDVEPSKNASIRRFLADGTYAFVRPCTPAYHESGEARRSGMDEVVLITDTVGDVKEARESGIRAIGVSWGMHTEEQLLTAGAEMVALWPQELVAWLMAHRDGACACACNGAGTCEVPASVGARPVAKHGLEERLHAAALVRRCRRVEAATRAGAARQPVAPSPARPDEVLIAAVRRILGPVPATRPVTSFDASRAGLEAGTRCLPTADKEVVTAVARLGVAA